MGASQAINYHLLPVSQFIFVHSALKIFSFQKQKNKKSNGRIRRTNILIVFFKLNSK